MKPPPWQVATLPRWPHPCRFPPTACVPRLGKLRGSQALRPSGAPTGSPPGPPSTWSNGRWSQGAVPLKACRTWRSTSTTAARCAACWRSTWDSSPWRERGTGRPPPSASRACGYGTTKARQRSPRGWNPSGETRPSLRHASFRCAHAGGLFSPPELGMPMLDAGWKRLIQQYVTRYNRGQKGERQ